MVWCHASAPAEAKSSSPRPNTSKQPGDPVAACTCSSPELLQPLWLRPALSQNATTAPEGAILPLGSADFPCSLPVWDGPAAALEAFLLVHRLAAAVRGKLRHAGRSSSPGRTAAALAAFLAAHCLTWGASDASTIYAEFDRQGLTADTVQNGVGHSFPDVRRVAASTGRCRCLLLAFLKSGNSLQIPSPYKNCKTGFCC